MPESAAFPTPLPVEPPAPSPSIPVVDVRPAAIADAPAAPLPLPSLGLAPQPQAEAPAPAPAVRVLARLSNGERIEVGAHESQEGAKAEATALMRFLREDGGDWPFLNGRFVRPDAIVSVDIVAG